MIRIVLFISIFATIYLLLHLYVYKRGKKGLPRNGIPKTLYKYSIIILPLFYILGVAFAQVLPVFLHDILILLGSTWFSILIYLFIIIITSDILKFISKRFNYYPEIIKKNPQKANRYITTSALLLILIIISVGYFTAAKVETREINLNINKNAGNLKKLRIILISDFHLGATTLFSWWKNSDKKIKYLNSLKGDILISAGDLVDRDILSVINKKYGEKLSSTKYRYGIYAVTGNHEMMGNPKETIAYFKKHNIKFLEDRAILIDNSFYLIGRKDLSVEMKGGTRKTLSSLLYNVNNKLPVILIDHQPRNLKESVTNGIDLQLSGHTHNGQLFPINLIVKLIYKIVYGYKKIGSTHFYVSSGLGTWGPSLRLGTSSEIVILNLHFNTSIKQ